MSHVQDAQIVHIPEGFSLPSINAHPIFPWPEKTMNNDRDRAFPATENHSPRASFSTLMETAIMSHQRSSLPLPQGLHPYDNFQSIFTQSPRTNSPVRLPPLDPLSLPSNANEPATPHFSVELSKELEFTRITNAHSSDHTKPQMLKNHRLMPRMMIFLESVKKDCFPIHENDAHHASYQDEDLSLDSFLMAQGFDDYLNDLELPLSEEQEEDRNLFREHIQQIKAKLQKETNSLDSVCSKAVAGMETILNSQSGLRPQLIIEEEKISKTKAIQQKFEGLKSALRQQACGSVLVLQKRFRIQNFSKKRKSLPKKATKVLSDWFFDHIRDPYPSEAEKIVLAAKGGLNLVQINYWFANKRIRYKKKCLEETRRKETAKRLKKVKEAQGLANSPSKPNPQNILPSQPSHNYDNIKLANPDILTPRTTPSIPTSLSKSVVTSSSSHFSFYEPTQNLNLPTNLAPLQVNRSHPLPSLPGISNFDPYFDPAAMAVPVPTFSDQRFPAFPSPRTLERI